MREIKFRAISIVDKTFIEGMTISKGSIKRKKDLYYMEVGTSDNWKGIDPETIGQYTGLKDKNDKDIYEGDILRACNSSLEITEEHAVTFEYGTFTIGRYWKDGQHDWCSMEQYESWELEVIGNIHSTK